ncbi:thioesterase family protein [Escherichia coli]|uniref:Thioesterase family protein n=1 Tax=Escherichia coli TaxID=562 RepID=A0A376VUQ4_ECOLX|nr:thioesterase family protein [Escherichia coli]
MSAVLTAEQALKLVGEMFVYHMPFNRALGDGTGAFTKKSSHSWPLKISQ